MGVVHPRKCLTCFVEHGLANIVKLSVGGPSADNARSKPTSHNDPESNDHEIEQVLRLGSNIRLRLFIHDHKGNEDEAAETQSVQCDP